MALKDYAAAIAAFQQALAFLRTLDSESEDVASVLNDLADVEQLSGDYTDALRIAQQINYREGVAYMLRIDTLHRKLLENQ